MRHRASLLVLGVLPLFASLAWADPAAEVDPFIGTDASNSPHPVPGGAGGCTFPGATAPFGMILWRWCAPTADAAPHVDGAAPATPRTSLRATV